MSEEKKIKMSSSSFEIICGLKLISNILACYSDRKERILRYQHSNFTHFCPAFLFLPNFMMIKRILFRICRTNRNVWKFTCESLSPTVQVIEGENASSKFIVYIRWKLPTNYTLISSSERYCCYKVAAKDIYFRNKY